MRPSLFHVERTGDLPEHEHRARCLRPTFVRQMRPRDDFGYVRRRDVVVGCVFGCVGGIVVGVVVGCMVGVVVGCVVD